MYSGPVTCPPYTGMPNSASEWLEGGGKGGERDGGRACLHTASARPHTHRYEVTVPPGIVTTKVDVSETAGEVGWGWVGGWVGVWERTTRADHITQPLPASSTHTRHTRHPPLRHGSRSAGGVAGRGRQTGSGRRCGERGRVTTRLRPPPVRGRPRAQRLPTRPRPVRGRPPAAERRAAAASRVALCARPADKATR